MSVADVGLFVVLVLTLGFAPGSLALGRLRQELEPLEAATLSVVLGLSLSASLYWLVMFVGLGRFFPVWPVVACAWFCYVRRGQWPRPRIVLSRWTLALGSLVAVGLYVVVTLSFYASNLVIQPDGSLRIVGNDDLLFHLAIAGELTHSIPPQNPHFAGHSLSYHYGMDLLSAMFAVAGGLELRDLMTRLMPPVLVSFGMLSVFCFARRWLDSRMYAVLAAALVFFGEDLSFVPGMLLGWQDHWSTLFGVPSVFSLFYVNPMLPGVGLLFAGLLCLLHYFRAADTRWLVLSALCLAVLVQVKVFTGLHIIGSLAVAALVYAVRFRAFMPLKVAAIALLLAAPVLVGTVARNAEGAGFQIILGPAGFVSGAMARMELGQAISSAPLLLTVGLPLYVVGSLGLRIVGTPALLRALAWPVDGSSLRFILAVFVAAGITVTLMSRIVPEKGTGYNNAVWLFVESKYVAWLFALEVMQRLQGWLRSRGVASSVAGAAIAVTALAVSTPSAVQYLTLISRQAVLLDASATATAQFLAGVAQPGAVVVADDTMTRHVLAFRSVRFPIGLYANNLVPLADFETRDARQRSFWEAWTTGEVRVDILRELDVRYVSAATTAPLRLPPGVAEIYANGSFVVLELSGS